MPVVTGIHHLPRKRSRREIELDNGEPFSLDLRIVAQRRIAVGSELTEEQIEEMRQEDEWTRAKATGFDLLRARLYSRKEMIDKLRRKGYSAEAAERAAASIEELGYISDEAYAEAFVDSRLRSKPKGRIALRRELRQKGIDNATIERTLTAVSDEDELEAARKLAEKQMRLYRHMPRETARRRLYQFLLRRGYRYEHVSAVLRETFDGADDGGEEEESEGGR